MEKSYAKGWILLNLELAGDQGCWWLDALGVDR